MELISLIAAGVVLIAIARLGRDLIRHKQRQALKPVPIRVREQNDTRR